MKDKSRIITLVISKVAALLLLLAGGQLLGVMSPRIDSLETMEGLLRAVYGPISVQPCKTRSGRTRLLLLKEEEP